jgi:hypothetical protein
MRSTVTLIERIVNDLGWNSVEIWKNALSLMPAEAEVKMLERFREVFTMDKLDRLGLAGFFINGSRTTA